MTEFSIKTSAFFTNQTRRLRAVGITHKPVARLWLPSGRGKRFEEGRPLTASLSGQPETLVSGRVRRGRLGPWHQAIPQAVVGRPFLGDVAGGGRRDGSEQQGAAACELGKKPLPRQNMTSTQKHQSNIYPGKVVANESAE